jgi:hypothetical protein
MSNDATPEARRRTEGWLELQEEGSAGQLVCGGSFASEDPAKVGNEPFKAYDFIRRDEARVEVISK